MDIVHILDMSSNVSETKETLFLLLSAYMKLTGQNFTQKILNLLLHFILSKDTINFIKLKGDTKKTIDKKLNFVRFLNSSQNETVPKVGS